MQPPSIIWFSRLFMLSMALSIVDVVMNWTEMMASLGQDGQIGGSDFTMIVAIISLVFGFGVPLLLWFLVVWRASRAAKWILTVFAALGLLFLAACSHRPPPSCDGRDKRPLNAGKWSEVMSLGGCIAQEAQP